MLKPHVVAVGGGHGLAATIRAVRRYAGRATAVVATADDGGSTGRLRDAMALPAPGDVRHCLVAMAGDDPDGGSTPSSTPSSSASRAPTWRAMPWATCCWPGWRP